MTTMAMTKHEGAALAPADQERRTSRAWASAPVDVLEGDDEYLVFADVPGVSSEGIDVQFAGGELRFHATRALDANGDRTLDYRRTISLGSNIDPAGITAELKSGVLLVRVPKAADAKPRQIAVRSGE